MSSSTHKADSQFVVLPERAHAIDTIHATLEAAKQGAGGSAFLIGEPGNGKSLLLETVAMSAADGVQVAVARGSSAESDLPFAYIEQVFGPLSSEEAAQRGVDDPVARRTVLHSLTRSKMRERAALGPVLYVLDDLQWADPDSLKVVAYLARRTTGMPVAFVGAARPWPFLAMRTLDELAHEGFASLVMLESLSRESAGTFLAAIIGEAIPPDVIDAAFQLTSGVPLLLREAGRTLRSEGGLPRQGLAEPRRRHSLLLLSQLGTLPTDTVRALQATAVLGTRSRVRLAQEISSMDEDEFAVALDIGLEAGVLRDEGDGEVAFRHEMLAAALAEDMPPAQRRLLHARAFAALVEVGELNAAVAHAVPAGLHGDCKAIEAVTAAAAAALGDGALETGMAHLDTAFELAGPAFSNELLERRGDALFLANRPEEARDAYRQLIRRTDPGEISRAVLAKATQCAAFTGQLTEALDSFDRLIKDCPPTEPLLADLVVERSHVVWELEGPAAALRTLDAVREDLLDRSSREKIELIRAAHLFQAGDLGTVSATEQRARQVLNEIAEGRPRDLQLSVNVILLHATNCGALERFDDTMEMVDRGVELFARSGAILPVVPLLISKLGVLLHSGALVETVAGVDDVEEEFDLGPLLAPYLFTFKTRALVALGRLDEARRARDEAISLPGGQSWFVQLGLDMARGQGLMARGRVGDAARVYDGVEETVQRVELRHPGVIIWAGEAIDTALAAKDYEAAERRTAWLEAHSSPQMGVWPRMTALMGRAGLAAARGDREDADRLYAAAVADPCPLELERARVLLRYGTWLRHSGRSVLARHVLAEVLQITEQRGAALLADEARQELSAAGGRRRRNQKDDELTAQQARVASLAATGATNREIGAQLHISSRTVESHLAAALLKLNVRTRAELRQRRRELGLASA